jgi:hypothetical protein
MAGMVCLRKIAIPSSRLAERSLAIRGSARLKRFLTTTIVTIRDVRARDQSEYVTRSETETRRMAEERERRGERGRRGGARRRREETDSVSKSRGSLWPPSCGEFPPCVPLSGPNGGVSAHTCAIAPATCIATRSGERRAVRGMEGGLILVGKSRLLWGIPAGICRKAGVCLMSSDRGGASDAVSEDFRDVPRIGSR